MPSEQVLSAFAAYGSLGNTRPKQQHGNDKRNKINGKKWTKTFDQKIAKKGNDHKKSHGKTWNAAKNVQIKHHLSASTTSTVVNGSASKEKSKEKGKSSIVLEQHASLQNKKARKSSESPNRHSIQITPTRVQNISTNSLTRTPSKQQLQEDGSLALAKHYFKWIINPISMHDFEKKHWQNAPLCISRADANTYFQRLISIHSIDDILRNNIIEFTKNIDITSYKNNIRETHNPEGRALPPDVWTFYRDGCSIRLLNPQTFIPQIHELSATLQEYFHCMCGANVYLTPPNSQGFAPHYDDIEAFVLQVEGKKHWRLYAARNEKEVLPRESSGNFKQEEIGKPIFERTLEAGDLLYFPRGTIHQAQTVPGHHSLHITLSMYQKTSFADLMEILVPKALERAIESDAEFREGLPLNIWNTMGLVHSGEPTLARSQNIVKLKQLFMKAIQYMDADEAVDKMAVKFQHDALPPVITSSETLRTVYGNRCKVLPDGTVCEVEFGPDTEIRLLRANILRLIACADNVYQVYFYSDNSKEYHEYEPNFMELDGDLVPAVEYLIKFYPKYVPIEQLPLSKEQNFDIAFILWSRGLIMLEEPPTSS